MVGFNTFVGAGASEGGLPNGASPHTVAIMQPYFCPYAGYFRLFAAADLFVTYDCVQFPRRGWVHRNRLPNSAGELHWLTLPFAKAPRDVLIKDLAFRADAAADLRAQAARFPILARRTSDSYGVLDALYDVAGNPVDYLERLLARCAGALDLPWRVIRSSTLEIPPALTGQERILAIARSVGARRYVNPSGGRALYDPAAFAAAGIELRFLSQYQGSSVSMLARLLGETCESVADEISRNLQLEA